MFLLFLLILAFLTGGWASVVKVAFVYLIGLAIGSILWG